MPESATFIIADNSQFSKTLLRYNTVCASLINFYHKQNKLENYRLKDWTRILKLKCHDTVESADVNALSSEHKYFNCLSLSLIFLIK